MLIRLLLISLFVLPAQRAHAQIRLVSDIDTGTSSTPDYFSEVNGKIYFQARRSETGVELFSFEPETGLTQLVSDINPGSASSFPGTKFLSSDEQNLYLSARSADGTTGLYSIDTDTGARSVLDIGEVSAKSNFSYVTKIDQLILFVGSSPEHPISTVFYHDIASGDTNVACVLPNSQIPDLATKLVEASGDLYFAGLVTSSDSTHVFRYDIATRTCNSVSGDVQPVLFQDSNRLFRDSEYIYFDGYADGTGIELARLNLDLEEVDIVTDINPDDGSSSPTGLAAQDGILYFGANNADSNYGLYYYDTDTQEYGPLIPDLDSYIVRSIIPSGKEIYISTESPNTNNIFSYNLDLKIIDSILDAYDNDEDVRIVSTHTGYARGMLYFSGYSLPIGSELYGYSGRTFTHSEAGIDRTQPALTSIAPNPLANQGVVRWSQERSEEVHIEIVDILGRRVLRVASGLFERGDHEARIYTDVLEPGTYLVRLSTSSSVHTQEMTVAR